MTKKTICCIALALAGCGVKGKPQPPLEPPLIGRGEPVFSEATQDIQIQKKAPVKIPDDWDDPKDFEEESSH
jgi:hypothetical protein